MASEISRVTILTLLCCGICQMVRGNTNVDTTPAVDLQNDSGLVIESKFLF